MKSSRASPNGKHALTYRKIINELFFTIKRKRGFGALKRQGPCSQAMRPIFSSGEACVLKKRGLYSQAARPVFSNGEALGKQQRRDRASRKPPT
ncbi:hypothetical protein AAC387_Pa05g1021 [Persea americana]